MRRLQALEIPTGDALLDLLPTLDAARRGDGPALLPVAPGEDLAGLRPGEELDPGEDADDDPTAFVVATSGSTGPPRGVLLAAGALAASAEATRERLALPGAAQWLLALPAQHVAGLQVLLRALAEGTTPTVLDTARPFTAPAFLAAAARMPGGPRVVSLVPTQLHRILAHPEATAALAGFDAVLVGGAATTDPLLEAARAAQVRIITTYGMSETCGGCVYDGLPLTGVQVLVDGPPPGPVSLRGPVVARGYRGRPVDPAFPGERTFRTSDLGLLEGPALRVVGRGDDVIISGGRKIDPQTVESALATLAGVAHVLVVGVPDAEWGQAVAALVVPRTPGVDLQVLRRQARSAAGPVATPRHLILVDELPSRGIGKPDRAAAAALARARLAGQ